MGAPRTISDHLPNKYISERTFRRCTSRKRDNIVLIDVDSDDFGDVIILDVPESFKKKFRKIPQNVISIDDDDGRESSDGAHPTNNDASTSNRCRQVDEDCDDILFDDEGNTPVKLSKSKRTYSRNRYGLSTESEGCTSESDCSDCELMEGSSGKLREQWEKASYRKRNDFNGVSLDFDDEAGPSEDPQPLDEQNNLKNCSPHPDDLNPSIPMDEVFTSTPSPLHNLDPRPTNEVVGGDYIGEVTKCPNKEGENDQDAFFNSQESVGILSLIPNHKSSCQSGNEGVSSSDHNSLITDRQKIKETEEYKHAMEQELAARQEQLLRQAEEARRLRNRKKAENMRIMMNEKRQKERLEEIRQTRIRDEENLNIKEKYRAEVKRELQRIEAVCYDMASLLRCLGIHVSGGPFPSQNEVQVAYKRACLKFHPDRKSASDLRQQVEAEEKFKLISNMKDKFMFK